MRSGRVSRSEGVARDRGGDVRGHRRQGYSGLPGVLVSEVPSTLNGISVDTDVVVVLDLHTHVSSVS